MILNYAVMCPPPKKKTKNKTKTGSTLPSATLKLSSLAPTKEAFVENVKRVHDMQL
jgi:hypothetical protein